MKRVLIITYYWPPTGGSGVQRWVKFAKFLPQYGWQPVVYAPENPERPAVDESLADDIPPEAEIVTHPIVEPYSLYRKIMGRGSSVKMTELTGTSGEKQSFKKKLSLFIRGNLFIPDPRVWWVKPSVRFLEKYLEKHPVDAVVSTGPPHSVHLIAKEVARSVGLPWLMDFRDPWTGIYYFDSLRLTAASKRKYFKMEQSCLDASSVVLTCTPDVQADFAARTRTPVEMVTNGYDEDDYRVEPFDDGFFNVTQTGQMGADGNPKVLWKVLSGLCSNVDGFRERLRVRLLGSVDDAVLESIGDAGLDGNLVNLGYRPHSAAVLEQVSAALLLIPLRDDPEMAKILPGKLFEYLAARRPILGFGQEDGAMARVLSATGAGRVCDWDDEAGVEEAVMQAWEKYLAGSSELPGDACRQYSRKELTGRVAAILDRL